MKRNIKKSKSGQAFIEFCMCVPIVIMMLFGLYDICKMNVLRIELQGYAQQAVGMYTTSETYSANPSDLLNKTTSAMEQGSTFCLGNRAGCSDPLPLKFKLGIRATGSTWKAGDLVCVRGEVTYTPFYKEILAKGKTNLYATACSSVEHNGTVPTSGEIYHIE